MHLNKLTQLGLSSDLKVGTCGFNPGRAQHCSVSLDSALKHLKKVLTCYVTWEAKSVLQIYTLHSSGGSSEDYSGQT